jgi:hypothetical protein
MPQLSKNPVQMEWQKELDAIFPLQIDDIFDYANALAILIKYSIFLEEEAKDAYKGIPIKDYVARAMVDWEKVEPEVFTIDTRLIPYYNWVKDQEVLHKITGDGSNEGCFLFESTDPGDIPHHVGEINQWEIFIDTEPGKEEKPRVRLHYVNNGNVENIDSIAKLAKLLGI